jgi:2-dehydro-3-deoxygluconokinase
MKFKENALYSLVVPTSMGVRLTPHDRQPVHLARDYRLQATSAESNVLSIAASLGMRTKVLTTFVKDSPIAKFIKNDLMFRNIEFEGIEVEQGGPWGYRHQFNIADSGYGLRGPRVHNDRSGEVGKTLNTKDFNLTKLFLEDGVKLIHISGLIASLSENSAKFCVELAKKAKTSGTKVSFDLNYRASFWKNRRDELENVFKSIAEVSDILIGNEEDFQLALNIPGPEAGGKNISDEIDSFKTLINNAKAIYPNTKCFATTLREVNNANEHLWGAVALIDEEWQVVLPRPIQVLDRIGGGDGFVGGFLYSLLKGFDSTSCLQFAWACGAYVVTLLDDYGLVADEEQIWSIYQGNARVKR